MRTSRFDTEVDRSGRRNFYAFFSILSVFKYKMCDVLMNVTGSYCLINCRTEFLYYSFFFKNGQKRTFDDD
jgi:hypothetical protein